MKYYFLILFLFFYAILFSQKKINDSLAKVLLENNTFKKNSYDKKYLLISSFAYGNNDFAKAKTEKGWGFINKKGKEIIPAIFDEVQNYQYFIAGIYRKKSSDNQKIKCKKAFNFDGKEVAEICQQEYNDARTIEGLGKYLKIRDDYNKTGIVDLEGKNIIPLNYIDISLFGNYFFCETNASEGTKSTDIVDEKGRFRKNILSTNIQHFMEKKNLVHVIDNDDKRFLLSLKTLEPVTEKYDWGQFREYSENPNFYIEHYDYYDRNRNYILNDKYEIINKDYPDSHPYLEKYLIHKTYPSGYTSESVTILNVKGKVLAKYLYEDYDRLSFFVPSKLDNPKYIEKNKERFLKYKYIQSINREENDSDAYRFFSEMGESVKVNNGSYRLAKNFNVIDTQNGNILFSIKPEKIQTAFFTGLKDPRFFIVYQNKTTAVYNKEGKLLRTLDFELKKDENSPLTLIVIQNNIPVNILDNNTYKKIFKSDFTYFSQTQNSDIYLVGNEKKYGFADTKGKIIKPIIYSIIDQNDDFYILLSENKYERFNIKTRETKYSINNNGIQILYDDGIIKFGKNAMIDLYGNYFQNYIEPETRHFYLE